MNGALVGAGWRKPEVLSLHPVMCFSYICLGEERKTGGVLYIVWQPFFSFFLLLWFLFKIVTNSMKFLKFFCQTYIYNVCLILFLSLIAKFGYTSLRMIALSYITKLGKKNTIVQCILLSVKKRCLLLSILNIPKYFSIDSRRVQHGTGVFMVCIMGSTMFLGG
jgi:hypothetical protein